jgi:hypothetical protein
MNYQRIYNQIIERAKTRQLEGYKEKHHILPRCMGGLDIKENLVELTAREHFLCHRLLCEIYPKNEKLKYSLWLMATGKQRWKTSDSYNISSRTYEHIKLEFSKLMKTKKSKLGRTHSEETKLKQSLSHLGKKDSKETKNKKSQIKLGHIKDNEWKKNLSESASKSFGRSVLQKDLNGNIIKEWETGKKASTELGLSYMAINACCVQNEKHLPRKRDKLKIGKYVSFNYIWEYK